MAWICAYSPEFFVGGVCDTSPWTLATVALSASCNGRHGEITYLAIRLAALRIALHVKPSLWSAGACCPDVEGASDVLHESEGEE